MRRAGRGTELALRDYRAARARQNALAGGDAITREATLNCWNRDDGQTYKAVVSIGDNRLISWEHRRGEQANFTETEFHECNAALKRGRCWRP